MRARPRSRALLVGLRRLGLVAVLVALLLGLGNLAASSGPEERQLDVVVAVDLTTSMSALDDPTGSRITAVRADLIELVENLPGARVAIIGFGRENRTLLPLTPDQNTIADRFRALQVELPTVGKGTSIGDVVSALQRQLALAAADAGTDERLPVVVLATDGENTRPGQQPSFGEVGDGLGAALVLGYGSTDGGVMPLERVAVDARPPTPQNAAGLVLDRRSGEPAVTRLDPANLETIAAELGGAYVTADGRQDMPELAADIEARALPDDDPARPARELRWLWALLLLALVLPELRNGWRQFLDARRAIRA